MGAVIRKSWRATVELKADKPGEFRATFSTFNVIDRDGDVTVPGAFKDGQDVRICAWGHNWGALPVGRGVLSQDDTKAWVDGTFFLDTEGGSETYKTVKNLGDLQEWSYGFDILEQSFGQFENRDVRFLRQLDVFEVSPVMIGAGIGTGTDVIKSANGQVELTTSERKTLEAVQARYVDAGKSLGALLGSAEDSREANTEDSPRAGNVEEPTAGKEGPTIRAGILTVQLGAELLELGAE